MPHYILRQFRTLDRVQQGSKAQDDFYIVAHSDEDATKQAVRVHIEDIEYEDRFELMLNNERICYIIPTSWRKKFGTDVRWQQ